MQAVRQTMGWVEKTFAEGRTYVDNPKGPVRTGHLTYALFQHDTSRKLDPQAHIHVSSPTSPRSRGTGRRCSTMNSGRTIR
jgi:conjugative relaxase-like TrwC/TraI family protein